MKYKYVFFGRIKTTQVQCPNCETWQFIDIECDNCGILFKEKLENEKPEYRTEVVTWRASIKRSIKEAVFQRDEYICHYCGIHCFESYIQDPKSVTIDHAYPISAGGRNNIDNLITCCKECNLTKLDKIFNTFEDAREYIKKQRGLSSGL